MIHTFIMIFAVWFVGDLVTRLQKALDKIEKMQLPTPPIVHLPPQTQAEGKLRLYG